MTRTMTNRLKFVLVRLVLISTLLVKQTDSGPAAMESDQYKNSTLNYVKRNDVNTNGEAPSLDKSPDKLDKTSEKSVFGNQLLSDDTAASRAKTQHDEGAKSTTSNPFIEDAANISPADDLNLATLPTASNSKEEQLPATPHLSKEHAPTTPNLNEGNLPATTRLTKEHAPTTPHLTKEHAPTTPHLTKEHAPTTPHLTKEHAPTTPNLNEGNLPATPHLTKEHAPTTPNLNEGNLPATPHLTKEHAPTTPHLTKEHAPTTPHLTKEHAPTTPHLTKEHAPTTPNLNEGNLPATPHLTKEHAPTTPHLTKEHAPTTPHLTKEHAPTTPHLTKEHAPTTPHLNEGTDKSSTSSPFIEDAANISPADDLNLATLPTASNPKEGQFPATPHLTKEHAPATPHLTKEHAPATPHLNEGKLPATPHLNEGKLPATPHLTKEHAPATPHLNEGKLPATPHLTKEHAPATPHLNEGKLPATPHLTKQHAPATPHLNEGKLPATPHLTKEHAPATPHLNEGKLPATPHLTKEQLPATPHLTKEQLPATPHLNEGKLPDTPYMPPSPFEKVENLFTDFESQVVVLHVELCGTSCRFAYSEPMPFKAKHCSYCFCDSACRVYDDCCPDKRLLEAEPEITPGSEEMRATTAKAVNRYTCEISHMRPKPNEAEYNNYFSMINYCPQASRVNNNDGDLSLESMAGSSKSASSEAGGSWGGLEAKCENRGSQDHWDYHRPRLSRQGLVYRNKFCAQCHGEHRDNLTDWMTKVTCDAHLLRTVSSASDAYFLALNTTECDVRFLRGLSEPKRHCSPVIAPIISSCNQTGLWKIYDERIERACASFTSVVHKRYKNVFCYICNDYVSFDVIKRHFEETGPDKSGVSRVSFSALLDLTDDEAELASSRADVIGTGSVSTDVRRKQCKQGTTLDPLSYLCRPVTCAAGLGFKGDNCTEVFAFTNYFGFTVYSRLYITSEKPIEPTVPRVALMLLVHALETRKVNIAYIMAYPALGCHDDRTLTLDVVVDVNSVMVEPLRVLVDSALEAFTLFPYRMVGLLSVTNVTMVTPSPYHDASRYYPQSIPLACPTRNSSLSMGPLSHNTVSRTDRSKMSFSPLENTTFCPRVNLTEAEFGNFTSRLLSLGLGENNVTSDITYGSGMTFYLVCAEDYRVILPRDECLLTEANNPREIKTVDTFEDDWTPEGMTSLVCTCISLVSLLCVIVSYAALPPLREGTGLCTLAMVCLLFVAQALHELGLEQYEIQQLCLVLAVLIHFFWLSAVFMMTSCTLHIFYSVTFPLRARARLDPGRALGVSLLASFSLTAAIIGSTMLANQLVIGDLGYPAKYLCFIRRGLSRQLGFGLPVGLAVLFNVVIFLIAIVSIRRRPKISSKQQDRISLVACVRLSIVTGACWLTLFLAAIPPIRAWLDYVTSALLGMQGLLLASTLLLNGRVAGLWRHLLLRRRKRRAARQYNSSSQRTSSSGSGTTSFQQDNSTKLESCEP